MSALQRQFLMKQLVKLQARANGKTMTIAQEHIENVVRNLRALHRELEKLGKINSDDWKLARNLEDVIGSGKFTPIQLEQARNLIGRLSVLIPLDICK